MNHGPKNQRKISQFLKNLGVEAACIIHTPFDESENGRYYLRTTLHVFYYGMIKTYSYQTIQFRACADLDGTNKTLFKVLQSCYLSAGIKKGMHPVSWIGKSMYCKLETENYKVPANSCPHCHNKLQQIYYKGENPPIPPDIFFDGIVDKKNWSYCFSESLWSRIKKFIRNLIVTKNTRS